MYNDDFRNYIKDENSDFIAFSRDAKSRINIIYLFFQRLLYNEKAKDVILPWINILADFFNKKIRVYENCNFRVSKKTKNGVYCIVIAKYTSGLMFLGGYQIMS